MVVSMVENLEKTKVGRLVDWLVCKKVEMRGELKGVMKAVQSEMRLVA